MAKSITRVYLLAKELGVKSQAIVEKCQAEGLDVKNHMATIGAGLAATIREWFSEGEHATTVEQAERVDLEKVRVPRKKKVSKAAEVETEAQTEVLTAQGEAEEAETIAPEAAAEPVEAPAAVETMEPPVVEEAPLTAPETAPEVQPAEAAPAPAPVVEEAPAVVPEEVRPSGPIFVPEPPKPTEPIKPAGPMLEKPKPAKLSGPTVIRVEKAEPDDRRPGRRSKPSRSRFDKPISEPLMPAVVAAGEKTEKKKKDKTHGRRKDHGKADEEDHVGRGGLKRMRAKDLEERQARLAAARGESLRARPVRRIEMHGKGDEFMSVERPERAEVTEPITVKDLSAALAVKVGDIISKLMSQGVMATANQAISTESAELIALEFGTELIVTRKHTRLELIEKEFAERSRDQLKKRPPVVAMLGHVDHGKTSLLDRIRKTSVAAGEAGGITQHIGAYQVELGDRRVTFLDTPGHEAFTSMRARGANMTDIVVLVVAADDGLMPQTIEAIHHAKAAGVEILVALNKIDLPGMDVNRIYGQLAEHGLTPTEWGGQTEIIKTSAVTGEGIENLIEMLDYIAELKDYRADPTIPAMGYVVEAKMTTSRGAVATLLLKEGQLNKGDTVLAGGAYGRIRSMTDSRGRAVKTAGPSMPVEIFGLDGVPQAGDKFYCLKDFNTAKEVAEEVRSVAREEALFKRSQVTLDNLFSQIEAGNIKELNLIIRADVQGSVDVLTKYLTELSTDEVKVKILHAAVGGITEGDVVLAEASSAIIIGFNVVPDERVRQIAESKGVDIRLYNIIYRITEDLRAAMLGMLEPEYEEKTMGRLVVRNTFKVSGVGTIAGCYVESGLIQRNARLRLIRDNIVLKDNCQIESLKHFKDDVREVKAGLECGVKIAGFDDVKVDDRFEVFEVVEMARKL